MATLELQDQIAALTVLQKRVKAELDARRDDWAKGARINQRDAAMVGEESLGTVSLGKPRVTLTVNDKDALIEWAMRERPELLSYDPHIAAADMDRLKKEVDVMLAETGELPPGFELKTGDPVTTVRLAKDADQVIQEAVNSGTITWDTVLAVEK